MSFSKEIVEDVNRPGTSRDTYMDASRRSSNFDDLALKVRMQSYIQPVGAGHLPAGPDGIRYDEVLI